MRWPLVLRRTHDRLVEETRNSLIADLEGARLQSYQAMRHGGSKVDVRGRLRLEGAIFALNCAIETVKKLLPEVEA